MAKLDLIGPGYEGRSKNVNASRCVNFYPEVNSQDSKSVVSLVGTPGLSYFTYVGSGIIRGMHVFNDLIFLVSENRLYSVNADGVVSSELGNDLQTSVGRVQMSDNGLSPTGGNQLIISDGVKIYVYNVSTEGFSTVDLTSYTNCFIGGYFAADVGGGRFQVSNLYDGSTWNGANLATAEAEPDDLVSVFNNHGELWLFGQYTTEVWYQAGTGSPPFKRVSGGVIDYGCAARHSVAKGNNTVFWLGNKRNGSQGQFFGVFMAEGYNARPISTQAIDYQIDNYTVIDDAFAYVYTEEGHEFYVLTFPTANHTWVYDTTTGFWHERSTYKNDPYNVVRHLGNCYCHYRNKHYVGDYQTSNILEMSSGTFKDLNDPIVSFRDTNHIFDSEDLNNIFISRLQVDIETGNEQEKKIVYSESNAINLGGAFSVYNTMYGNGYFWINCHLGPTNRRVVRVDEVTHEVVAFSGVPSSDQKIYYDANDNKFYIIDDGDNKLYVYNDDFTLNDSDDSRTFNKEDQIESIGDFLYVTDYDNDRLEKIDKINLVRDSYADLGGVPLYITNNGSSIVWVLLSGGTIKAINIETMTVSTLATGIDYYSSGKIYLNNVFLYFKDSLWCVGDDIQQININDGKILYSISRIDTSIIPTIVGLDNYIYVSNASSESGRYDITSIEVDNHIVDILVSAEKVPGSYGLFTKLVSDTNNNSTKIAFIRSFLFNSKLSILNKTNEIVDGNVTLSWSNDNGNTWSDEHSASIGAIGEYTKRLVWNRLGRARNKTFRIAISSPIKKVLLNQHIKLKKGSN